LHVVTKNLQSIRSEDRLADFYCDLDNASFDFLLLTETWRSETQDNVVTSVHVYLVEKSAVVLVLLFLAA